MDPAHISSIPNAVDTNLFLPDPSKRWPKNTINIVVLSRLTFRKGTDFLIDILPNICKKYPEVHFIVGGDGPKLANLIHIIEKNGL
jgi:phosphatidylinositol glycan class A protein